MVRVTMGRLTIVYVVTMMHSGSLLRWAFACQRVTWEVRAINGSILHSSYHCYGLKHDSFLLWSIIVATLPFFFLKLDKVSSIRAQNLINWFFFWISSVKATFHTMQMHWPPLSSWFILPFPAVIQKTSASFHNMAFLSSLTCFLALSPLPSWFWVSAIQFLAFRS